MTIQVTEEMIRNLQIKDLGLGHLVKEDLIKFW